MIGWDLLSRLPVGRVLISRDMRIVEMTPQQGFTLSLRYNRAPRLETILVFMAEVWKLWHHEMFPLRGGVEANLPAAFLHGLGHALGYGDHTPARIGHALVLGIGEEGHI